MDAQGFRYPGRPNLVEQPSNYRVKQESLREIDAMKTTPAPDSRYSAYAAPMSDGRLVTDYRDKCVSRAPPGFNFATKQWLVHNADEVMKVSRERQMQNTGQALGVAKTDMPPALYQSCSTDSCQIQSSGFQGIGIERLDKAPELFGTFDVSPSPATLAKNKTFLALNQKVEYGRNTASRWAHLYQ